MDHRSQAHFDHPIDWPEHKHKTRSFGLLEHSTEAEDHTPFVLVENVDPFEDHKNCEENGKTESGPDELHHALPSSPSPSATTSILRLFMATTRTLLPAAIVSPTDRPSQYSP